MVPIADHIAQIAPETNKGWGITVDPLRDALVGSELRATTLVLAGVVGFVLLMACANVANLMLARGAARRKETAVRLSLGASRGRLVRQAFIESLLLAGAGCVLGVGFAFWGQRGILQFLPSSAGDPFGAGPSAIVLAFTAGISLLSAILFGLTPALRSIWPSRGPAPMRSITSTTRTARATR